MVLVIDDDSIFSDVLGNRLKVEGIGCVFASSSETAFELLQTVTPSVILLDVMIPGINGMEILKHLKQDPQTATIPVIMFSNDSTNENIKESESLGATLFLEKVNVTPGEVVSTIRSYIK